MYQAIILGCVLVVTLYILRRSRTNSKLNMPPLVHYRIPIIGHTLSFLFNCEEFLKQCKKEYGDVFSLYIWGRITTYTGKEHLQEVLARDDVFNFGKIVTRSLPMDAMLTNSNGIEDVKYNTKVIKEYIINKLGLYTERMQKCLYSATKKYIGDDDEQIIYNIYNVLIQIIANPTANVFIGEEESKYDDIITTFAKFTSDVALFFVIPPIFDFIYPGLQAYINRIPVKLGLFNPGAKHRNVLVKHIKNQVEKRLREKQKYGDSWKRPDDLLQDFMEEEDRFDPNNINYAEIADKMCIFIFASIHTTSRSTANAIVDLASRPEYMQELYEEQLEIRKKADENNILPFEALDEMKKLDSFIRESLRLSGDIAALPHLVLKDYTFSNGLQVPKDHVVDLYFDDVIQDELLQGPNPKSFEPWRHVNTNASASKVSRNYVVFGGGKHACPGRLFAINEMKFFMHNAILKYNFRTESGKLEEKGRMGPISIPSNCGIVFEKRIKY